MLNQVQAIDYSGETVKVISSNGSQWTAQKVKKTKQTKRDLTIFFSPRWVGSVFLFFKGSCYGPVDFTSEEPHSFQSPSSWEKTQSNPQFRSWYYREGIWAVLSLQGWFCLSGREKQKLILSLKLFKCWKTFPLDCSSVPVSILGQKDSRGRLLWENPASSWKERHVQCLLWSGSSGWFIFFTWIVEKMIIAAIIL